MPNENYLFELMDTFNCEDNLQKFIKAVKALDKIFKIPSRRYSCHVSRVTKSIKELAPKNNVYSDEIAVQCELETLSDHCENSTKYDEIMKISEKLKNMLYL